MKKTRSFTHLGPNYLAAMNSVRRTMPTVLAVLLTAACTSIPPANAGGLNYNIVRGGVRDCELARKLLDGKSPPTAHWLIWTDQDPGEQLRFIRRFPYSDIEFYERAKIQNVENRVILHGRITSYEPTHLESLLAIPAPDGGFYPIEAGRPVFVAKDVKLLPDPGEIFECGTCVRLKGKPTRGYGVTSDVAIVNGTAYQVYRSGRAGYVAMFKLSLSDRPNGETLLPERTCLFNKR